MKKTKKYVYRVEKKNNFNSNNKNNNNGKKKKTKPKQFIYQYANGTVLSNDETLKRIKSIGCPPAWRNVEIYPNANAELGCTGYDIAGRKQWKYTRLHDLRIEKEKFCTLMEFGKKLPDIRAKYQRTLASNSEKNMKKKMIALILKIIESCNFRIGTERCRKTYDSHGMTTILKEHVDLKSNGSAIIDFIGKKGVRNFCKIKDPQVVKLLNEIKYNAANKEKIFKYKNSRKGTSYITFLDINDYLLEFGNFTSKMFRTWAANKYLLEELEKHPIEEKITNRKKTLRESIKIIAEKLHHTPAICKSKYLCRELLDLYVDKPKRFEDIMRDNKIKSGLGKYESIFLNFLEKYYKKRFCNTTGTNKESKHVLNLSENNKKLNNIKLAKVKHNIKHARKSTSNK